MRYRADHRYGLRWTTLPINVVGLMVFFVWYPFAAALIGVVEAYKVWWEDAKTVKAAFFD